MAAPSVQSPGEKRPPDRGAHPRSDASSLFHPTRGSLPRERSPGPGGGWISGRWIPPRLEGTGVVNVSVKRRLPTLPHRHNQAKSAARLEGCRGSNAGCCPAAGRQMVAPRAPPLQMDLAAGSGGPAERGLRLFGPAAERASGGLTSLGGHHTGEKKTAEAQGSAQKLGTGERSQRHRGLATSSGLAGPSHSRR